MLSWLVNRTSCVRKLFSDLKIFWRIIGISHWCTGSSVQKSTLLGNRSLFSFDPSWVILLVIWNSHSDLLIIKLWVSVFIFCRLWWTRYDETFPSLSCGSWSGQIMQIITTLSSFYRFINKFWLVIWSCALPLTHNVPIFLCRLGQEIVLLCFTELRWNFLMRSGPV